MHNNKRVSEISNKQESGDKRIRSECNNINHVFETLKLKIYFPYKPYGVQKAMMGRITQCLKNNTFSLIESPTGTGKTLVLLCSTLAWQHKSRQIGYNFVSDKCNDRLSLGNLEECKRKLSDAYNVELQAEDIEELVHMASSDSQSEGVQNNTSELSAINRLSSVSKILYCTRTHKQITQVINELNKTYYRDKIKVCILSSREQSCINESVRYLKNKNEKCQELIEKNKTKSQSNNKCPYYTSSMVREFVSINKKFDNRAWDIEDAIKFGRSKSLCPFFGTRNLQADADIIFTPYNYILDPNVREMLNIDIRNSVIIFDEAHNIEQVCCDSASFEIDTIELNNFIQTMSSLTNTDLHCSTTNNAYMFLVDSLKKISNSLEDFWLGENSCSPSGSEKILSSSELKKYLEYAGLGSNKLSIMRKCLKTLNADDAPNENKSSKKNRPSISASRLLKLKKFYSTLKFMYIKQAKNITAFRGVITKTTLNDLNNNSVWRFEILCMSPSVLFDEISKLAWSVVVTSGTLSPIESLKSELGCTFECTFNGTHVLNREQVFACIASRGPNEVDLDCSFKNSNNVKLQDEIGYIIKDVCGTVPNGIVCFFPSYIRLEMLHKRWTENGTMMHIKLLGKRLFIEKQFQNTDQFKVVFDSFSRSANDKGAMLFAVFRGKVSEGIDFSDNTARAVITIGIPFSNLKNSKINIKRAYNDKAKADNNELLGGDDWYSNQAFRAFNQAVGRCIRHESDWGAIIMIDSRLLWRSNLCYITNWLRSLLQDSSDFGVLRQSLKRFVSKRQC